MARIDAGAAHAVHEIPNREPFTDVLGGEFLSSRVDDEDTDPHQRRSQRYIRRDRHVSADGVLGDISVGDIGSAFDAHC